MMWTAHRMLMGQYNRMGNVLNPYTVLTRLSKLLSEMARKCTFLWGSGYEWLGGEGLGDLYTKKMLRHRLKICSTGQSQSLC